MTINDKGLLIAQAAELYELGLQVERRRSELKKLVEAGVEYNDPQMLQAYESFVVLECRWKYLEEEHLRLRERLIMRDI